MRAIVWMDSWQQECCGEPFEVGSRVAWSLEPADEDEWLCAVLAPADAQAVTHREEHHDGRTDETPRVAGTVRSIRAVWCRYAPAPGEDSRIHYPVPGSAVIEPVFAVESTEPEKRQLSFVGYLVELAVDGPRKSQGAGTSGISSVR